MVSYQSVKSNVCAQALRMQIKDTSASSRRSSAVLTSDSPAKTTRTGLTGAETRCCLSSSGETGGPSDRWPPAPGKDVLPPGCSDRESPSSTYRVEKKEKRQCSEKQKNKLNFLIEFKDRTLTFWRWIWLQSRHRGFLS